MPMIRSEETAELWRLSGVIGSDIRLVQGSGGNTSIKDDAVLWIKASGTWLADAEHGNIFLPLDLGIVHMC